MTNAFELILLRHGESTWNADDRFAGWVDIPLTERGRVEATRAGHAIESETASPDVVHTSLLRRAISTADIVLDTLDRHWIPVHRTWRLNERHYGALQGCSRSEIRTRYGPDLFTRWRRSFDEAPPAIAPGSSYGQEHDARYRGLGIDVPVTESLHDVSIRLLPYWDGVVVPDLRAGKTVLLVAHGNVLRTLLIHLRGMPSVDADGVRISTGVPLSLTLDSSMRVVRESSLHGGQ